MLEDREVLVPVCVDLVSAAPTHRVADDAADVLQQGCVALAQTSEQKGGTLDVGQEEGHRAGRERREVGRPVAALRSELPRDEPDGNEAVLLRRVQQPPASFLPRRIVLEPDPFEPAERVPHVRLVVDRQPPPTIGVDVGERPIGEARPLTSAELGHGDEDTRSRRRRPREGNWHYPRAPFEHYFEGFPSDPAARPAHAATYGLEVDMDRVRDLCEEHGLRFPPLVM
jgi:hypothetical protein